MKLPDATWERLRRIADERMVGHGLILAKAIDYYLDILEKQDPLQAPPSGDPGPIIGGGPVEVT